MKILNKGTVVLVATLFTVHASAAKKAYRISKTPREFTLADKCSDDTINYNNQCFDKCKDGYTEHTENYRYCQEDCPYGYTEGDSNDCIKPLAYKLDKIRSNCGEHFAFLDGDLCQFTCPRFMLDLGESCVRKTYLRQIRNNICEEDDEYVNGFCYEPCTGTYEIESGPFCLNTWCNEGSFNCGGLLCIDADEMCPNELVHWSYLDYEEYALAMTDKIETGETSSSAVTDNLEEQPINYDEDAIETEEEARIREVIDEMIEEHRQNYRSKSDAEIDLLTDLMATTGFEEQQLFYQWNERWEHSVNFNASYSQSIFGFEIEASGYAHGQVSSSNRDDWKDGKLEANVTMGGEVKVTTPEFFGESAELSASGEMSHTSSVTMNGGLESGLTPNVNSDIAHTLNSATNDGKQQDQQSSPFISLP